ncbi:hypothetical protein [Candidatus Frankia alpina]|uniref:hypothetical protein n=1 Tax=Candidatus Frankia alpina TaxID=2699483 RepID=UPI003013C0F1
MGGRDVRLLVEAEQLGLQVDDDGRGRRLVEEQGGGQRKAGGLGQAGAQPVGQVPVHPEAAPGSMAVAVGGGAVRPGRRGDLRREEVE